MLVVVVVVDVVVVMVVVVVVVVVVAIVDDGCKGSPALYVSINPLVLVARRSKVDHLKQITN